MNGARERFKNKLDQELEHIQFTKTTTVIEQVSSKTWGQRLRSLWNKEIEIPLVPMSIVGMLFVVIVFQPWQFIDRGEVLHHQERQLIEVAGNTYWKNDFEKLVILIEN